MTHIQRINDENSATELAALLNGNSRRRPVVVVTIPAGRTEPWIDVEQIARESGNLAEVFLMPTGPFTWEFSNRMPDGTQVYGGAGRVYPVGHAWASDLTKSPLRFAFGADDGERATEHLTSDALRMAAAAGLLQTHPSRELRPVSGRVKMTVAGRALVDVGNHFPASVAEELTVEDVPIDRIVMAGQQIEGSYDQETNRIDVTNSLRPPGDALSGYAVGNVVLAKVAAVRNVEAEFVLYPKTMTPATTVAVLRQDVTDNPADDLRTLMTVGEVIPVRVTATGPHWALVLNDIDDDEQIIDPPSLLPGGPPWLTEESEETPVEEPEPLAPPPPDRADLAERTSVEQALDTLPPSPPTLRAEHPRPGPNPAPSIAAGATDSTRSLLLKIDGLVAENRRLEAELEAMCKQLQAAGDEKGQLRYLLDRETRRANRAENDLKAARSRLRKAGNAKSGPATDAAPRFADPELGFRYQVLTQWARRTQVSEQSTRPLPDFVVGERFLESVARLEGIKEGKVADVVFEIVTGLAPQIPGREVHRLRTGTGGDDPVRVRADGAIAWRASLQVNTPSARRIHYWALPNGQFELARVATHDDFDV